MKVLVTDGDERAALAVTRSLGRQGIEVVVGALQTPCLAGVSRYCAESFVSPSPVANPEGYVASLLNIVRGKNIGMIFPITDMAMALVGAARSQFEPRVTLPIPSMAAYEQLSDKYELMQLATRLQVPVPDTVFVAAGGLTDSVLEQVTVYPVVVKPARSMVNTGGVWTKTSVHHARTRDELQTLYREINYLTAPSMIQRRVQGEGQGLFALINQGVSVATFAHRRLREKPPSGGVSVLRESMAVPKEMSEEALRLLEAVGWHGVAMVEFKMDEAKSRPVLMEVNGRWWGSLQLAIDAGIDFPFLMHQIASGLPWQGLSTGYRVGTRSRWFLGDLDHLLLRLTRSDAQLNMPANSPGRWRCLIDFLQPGGREVHWEVERWDDVRPARYEWGRYIRALLPFSDRQWSALGLPFRSGRMAAGWVGQLPSRLTAGREFFKRPRPEAVKSILVACTGNVCRSPLVEAYLKAQCLRRGLPIDIRSVGLDTSPGHPANPSAQKVGSRHGLPLEEHRTTMFTPALGAASDLILVMDLGHRTMLLKQYAAGASKVVMLGYFDRLFYDISDPFGKSDERFEQCFEQIRRSCDRLLESLSSR
jgi:protein-tyrosine-phosphatase/predicted ATP-grasp superfamily ATP-dependent carboligase